MTRCASRTLTSSEVLAVCKILLDSRSMVKDEMFPIWISWSRTAPLRHSSNRWKR